MSEITLAGFKNGIDNITARTALEPGFCLDAMDVVINRQGEIENRPGKRRLLNSAGMHSLWWSRTTGLSLCFKDGYLCRARIYQGAMPCTPIYDVGAALGEVNGASAPVTQDSAGVSPAEPIQPIGTVSYCEFDGAVWASDGQTIWRIVANHTTAEAQLATLPVPSFSATQAGSGGLYAGQYAVGVSFLDERLEEGALSAMLFVNVGEGGGVAVTVQWPSPRGRVAAALVHLSPANGDMVHRCLVVTPTGDSDTVIVGIADKLGKPAATRYKRPMPAGTIIRQWRGHLLTVRSNVLYFSEPMYYGINDPRTGFIVFGSDITMLEAVEGGLFVGTAGTANEVTFLSGSKPGEWTRRLTGAAVPVPGASTIIPANEFGGAVNDTAMPIAIWLTNQGYTLGMPDGSINEVQSGRLKLPDWVSGCIGWNNRRVWACVS